MLVDAAPIICWLEGHPKLARRFEPAFARHAAGGLRLAVSTTKIAEVLAGPFGAGEEVLPSRYRRVLESWEVVPLMVEIAEAAARFRARLRLKLPDAIQVASAIAVNAEALVTHDRDFSRVKALSIVS